MRRGLPGTCRVEVASDRRAGDGRTQGRVPAGGPASSPTESELLRRGRELLEPAAAGRRLEFARRRSPAWAGPGSRRSRGAGAAGGAARSRSARVPSCLCPLPRSFLAPSPSSPPPSLPSPFHSVQLGAWRPLRAPRTTCVRGAAGRRGFRGPRAERELGGGRAEGAERGKPWLSGARRKPWRTRPRSQEHEPAGICREAALHLSPGPCSVFPGGERLLCPGRLEGAPTACLQREANVILTSNVDDLDRSDLPSLGHGFQAFTTRARIWGPPRPPLHGASWRAGKGRRCGFCGARSRQRPQVGPTICPHRQAPGDAPGIPGAKRKATFPPADVTSS